MSIALEKLMNLEDGQVLYNDLRERIENLPTGSNIVIPIFTLDATSQNPNTWTCDMTWEELATAINNGDCMACKRVYKNQYGTDSSYLSLVGITGEDSDCIKFESVLTYGTETRSRNIKFYDDETVTYTYNSSDLSDKADKADTVLDTTLSRGRKANTTVGTGSFAFGDTVEASGTNSHAEGGSTTASGYYAHAEGGGTTASNANAHAEGGSTTASGQNSHAEGAGTTASYGESHAEGSGTIAGNNCAHAEGNSTIATGHAAHAEGNSTEAPGAESHSEGDHTQANGYASHAEGEGTIANANASHVGGQYNVADGYGPEWEEWTPNKLYHVGDKVKQTFDWGAVYYICSTENSDSEFIYGHWEIDNYRMNYVEIIGNGTDDDNRSNARSLDWKGNEHLAGDVYVHANADGSGGSKLPDESRVNALIATAVGSITGFDAEVVQALPQTGVAGTIYLVPKQGSGTDVHDEYIYVNDAWELIGTTQIDISNKADKADTVLDTILSRGRKANTTVGTGSFAFGNNVEASGNYSHAEGNVSSATGPNSHAEGYLTVASSDSSHAEGNSSRASGVNSHAEGFNTNAMGSYSHAEGYSTQGNNDYKPKSYNVSNDTITFTTVNQKPGAVGNSSHSEGYLTVASGQASHAEGGYTFADGDYAHAEGSYTNATDDHAHSEGYNTTASSDSSHAEGANTIASGVASHSEGTSTVAYGMYSHAEGFESKATAGYSHAEGYHTKSGGLHSHTEGYRTAANADDTHAEGNNSEANGNYSHAEGLYGRVNINGYGAHSEGYGSATNKDYPQYNAPIDRTANFNGRTQPGTSINLPTGAHAQGAHNEGTYTTANANSSHAEGYSTLTTADYSHAEGFGSIVTGGPASHAEGKYTYASGAGGAHAEGQYTVAQGAGGEHAEGMYTIANGGGGTHAEGFATYVSGSQGAHAEGYYTYGTGSYGFHIEGDHTECSVGNGAHTEGYYTKSFGSNGAHTEGVYTIGRGEGSHTGGRYNIPNSCNNLPDWEPNKLYHVGDKVKHLYPGYETPDGYMCRTEHTSGSEFSTLNWSFIYSDNGYAEIIGNGTADDARANARALDWEGNEHLAGNLYVGCNPDSTGGTKVLTENDLEYTTEADALKIISDFWEEEEDDSVIAEMVLTSNGYGFESVLTANEIGALIESGKMVILHFPGIEGSTPDSYIPIASYAPAVEGSQNYPYPSFALCDIAQSSPYMNLVHELNSLYVDSTTGKICANYAD